MEWLLLLVLLVVLLGVLEWALKFISLMLRFLFLGVMYSISYLRLRRLEEQMRESDRSERDAAR